MITRPLGHELKRDVERDRADVAGGIRCRIDPAAIVKAAIDHVDGVEYAIGRTARQSPLG